MLAIVLGLGLLAAAPEVTWIQVSDAPERETVRLSWVQPEGVERTILSLGVPGIHPVRRWEFEDLPAGPAEHDLAVLPGGLRNVTLNWRWENGERVVSDTLRVRAQRTPPSFPVEMWRAEGASLGGWSPEGGFLLVARGDSLRILTAAGDPVAGFPRPERFCWVSEDTLLALADGTFRRWTLDGGDVSIGEAPAGEQVLLRPAGPGVVRIVVEERRLLPRALPGLYGLRMDGTRVPVEKLPEPTVPDLGARIWGPDTHAASGRRVEEARATFDGTEMRVVDAEGRELLRFPARGSRWQFLDADHLVGAPSLDDGHGFLQQGIAVRGIPSGELSFLEETGGGSSIRVSPAGGWFAVVRGSEVLVARVAGP